MSRETIEWLNQNTLIGYTDKRGTAWHAMKGYDNHYAGAVPLEDVRKRLFSWTALEGEVTATALTEDGVLTMTDPTRKAIMRSDTGAILGLFRSGYVVHQYDEWLVQQVETILDADLKIAGAGLLKGGGQAWVQIEMEDTLSVNDVEFRPFLLAATSMDGSLATTYKTGATAVVCDNTMNAALAETGERVKIRHSTHSLGRIGEVRDALGILHSTADSFAAEVRALTETTVTDAQWRAFLTATVGDPEAMEAGAGQSRTMRIRGEMEGLYRHDERAATWTGTAYGVLAAANTHAHHYLESRGRSKAERNMSMKVTGAWDTVDSRAVSALRSVGVALPALV